MTAAVTSNPCIEKKVNRTVVRLRQGDLTAMAVDAIVFYAREDLSLGSGYGTAIQSRGGSAVKKDLERIGGLGIGEAVLTGAGNLQAKHIIHACGPKFQEADTERKLRDAMVSALRLAEQNQLRALAFPAMGAGFYGVPLALCAQVMTESIRDFITKSPALDEITICVMDRRDFLAFQSRVEAL